MEKHQTYCTEDYQHAKNALCSDLVLSPPFHTNIAYYIAGFS